MEEVEVEAVLPQKEQRRSLPEQHKCAFRPRLHRVLRRLVKEKPDERLPVSDGGIQEAALQTFLSDRGRRVPHVEDVQPMLRGTATDASGN